MLATGISYIVVQAPAWAGNMNAARWCSLAALILSAICFVGYSAVQVMSSRALEQQHEMQVQARKQAMLTEVLDLATLVRLEEEEAEQLSEAAGKGALSPIVGGEVTGLTLRKVSGWGGMGGGGGVPRRCPDVMHKR